MAFVAKQQPPSKKLLLLLAGLLLRLPFFHYSILGYEKNQSISTSGKRFSNQFAKHHKKGHRNLNQFPVWKY